MRGPFIHIVVIALCLAAGQPAFADQAFRGFIETLWPKVKPAKISRSTFEAAFAGIDSPDPAVLKLAANQPEFTSTTSEYLSKAVTEARIATGRDMLASRAGLLAEIEKRYGVDRHILLAIWGIESNFGKDKGSMPVIRSLATLAYQGRRQGYAQPQIVAALRILESGVVPASRFTGSWAGAMGHTQFIPTSYLSYAVDWTGDKKRDIWNSEADALASTANYLRKSGWSNALPWGWEVRLPAKFNNGLIGRGNTRSIGAWKKMGIVPVRGEFRSLDSNAFLLIPQGLDGPVFLVTQNFNAIRNYNDSHSYAVAVGHLADRIRGQGPIVAPWPAQNISLTYQERVEMQKRLIQKGFPTGGTDGRFGARTYEAIIAFQKSRNLATNGVPDRDLLERLRKGS
jgi:membrane-bound lytic murein transglycosylase B